MNLKIQPLIELFDFKTGKLPALEHTEEGDVPLVYGTTENNGVIKFVEVEGKDQIFKPPLVTVSYLGTAFVQVLPFTTSVVDKSNIIVLSPKEKKMTMEEMYFYAFQINRIGRFGFHYGRRMGMKNLRKMKMFLPEKDLPKVNIKKLLPALAKPKKLEIATEYESVPLTKLFTIQKAKSKGFESYEKGDIPFITNGIGNNGVQGFVKPNETARVFKTDAICVSAFCEATVQKAPFLPRGNGGSGLSVLVPKQTMSLDELLLHASYINKVYGWRFSYGRMIKMDRLKDMKLLARKEQSNIQPSHYS
jgi:hypothetical protein